MARSKDAARVERNTAFHRWLRHVAAPGEALQSLQRERLTLFDVGARGGLDTLWGAVTPVLRVIGFEPDPKVAARTYSNISYPMEFIPLAAGGRSGPRTFYKARHNCTSSFLRPNEPVTRLFGIHSLCETTDVRTVETITLDDVVRDRQLKVVDFIKVDTQGSELEILEGATTALGDRVFGLELEVEFVELYEGQPLFADVDRFVRPFGFELITLRQLRHLSRRGLPRFAELGLDDRDSQLTTADAVYFRSPHRLASLLESADAETIERTVAGAVAACLVYRVPDYAAHVIDLVAPRLGAECVEKFYSSLRTCPDSNRQLVPAHPPPLSADDGELGGTSGIDHPASWSASVSEIAAVELERKRVSKAEREGRRQHARRLRQESEQLAAESRQVAKAAKHESKQLAKESRQIAKAAKQAAKETKPNELGVLEGAPQLLARGVAAWQIEVAPGRLRNQGTSLALLVEELQRRFTHFINLDFASPSEQRVRPIAELQAALEYLEAEGQAVTHVLVYRAAQQT